MEGYRPIRQKTGKVANQKERLEWSSTQTEKRQHQEKRSERERGKDRRETQR